MKFNTFSFFLPSQTRATQTKSNSNSISSCFFLFIFHHHSSPIYDENALPHQQNHSSTTVLNLSKNCQSTHKSHKSQPSILPMPCDSTSSSTRSSSSSSVYSPSSEMRNRIDTHLAPSSTSPHDNLFNLQRNNVKIIRACGIQKSGNAGDPNSYVHEDSNVRTSTTSSPSSTILFMHTNNIQPTTMTTYESEKVTQLPNVIQSFSSMLSYGGGEELRRGNKLSAVDERLQIHGHNSFTSCRGEMKTFIGNGNGEVAMVAAAQQISHFRDSNENASSKNCVDLNFKLSTQRDGDAVDRNRYSNSVVRMMEKVHGGRKPPTSSSPIECDISCSSLSSSMTTTEALTTPSSLSIGKAAEFPKCNSLLPSSSSHQQPTPQSSTTWFVQSQHEYHPATTSNATADLHTNKSTSSHQQQFPSSSTHQQNFHVENENVDYHLRRNVKSPSSQQQHAIDVVRCNLVGVNKVGSNKSVNVNVIECNNFMSNSNHANPNENNNINNNNHSTVNNVKIFNTSTEKSSNESTTKSLSGHQILKSDNLIITSAIENLSNGSTMMTVADSEKFTSVANGDGMMTSTKKEKRRRDRRDRRLARTRATNGAPFSVITTDSTLLTSEIAPDIHLPPAYADVHSQPIVPSVISTVPVEDNHYAFSLPLVRRWVERIFL